MRHVLPGLLLGLPALPAMAGTPGDDLAAQAFSRRRWLEGRLFWDLLARNFVPHEAWSAVNAPPTVHF